jgi:hypothetical protein
VAFTSFVPSGLARPGVLDNLVLYAAGRAAWAHEMLS